MTSVTVSEIRSQIHRLETTMEGNFEHIPEPDKPSWVFPGDIVELHAPEDDILFHEECDRQIPSNDHQQQEKGSTTGGELQEEQDNIPHGLSPIGQYIPAGAEGGESNSSSSTCEEEETVEEGLARYFSNPSYRATNPALLEPIDPEEDWEILPLCFYHCKSHKDLHNQQQGLKRDRDICRREKKEEDKVNGEEIMIKTT